MASYPVEIRRCGHIRSNGTQCGSPALKEKQFCYYHQQNRPQEAPLYIDGEQYSAGEIMIPVLEDAHSIQTTLRQVLLLLFQRRIERKDAGLALYALQIASGNLKRMEEEKPKPTQVVVDPEKVAETPLGMTPWSETGKGHDLEEGEREGDVENYGDDEDRLPIAERLCSCLKPDEGGALRNGFVKAGLMTWEDAARYRAGVRGDPLLDVFERLSAGEAEESCSGSEKALDAHAEAAKPPHSSESEAATTAGHPGYILWSEWSKNPKLLEELEEQRSCLASGKKVPGEQLVDTDGLYT